MRYQTAITTHVLDIMGRLYIRAECHGGTARLQVDETVGLHENHHRACRAVAAQVGLDFDGWRAHLQPNGIGLVWTQDRT